MCYAELFIQTIILLLLLEVCFRFSHSNYIPQQQQTSSHLQTTTSSFPASSSFPQSANSSYSFPDSTQPYYPYYPYCPYCPYYHHPYYYYYHFHPGSYPVTTPSYSSYSDLTGRYSQLSTPPGFTTPDSNTSPPPGFSTPKISSIPGPQTTSTAAKKLRIHSKVSTTHSFFLLYYLVSKATL